MASKFKLPSVKEMADWPVARDLRDQVDQTLDRFYETIGTHHHGVSGHVPVPEPPAAAHHTRREGR
jgi:hypothetical protein